MALSTVGLLLAAALVGAAVVVVLADRAAIAAPVATPLPIKSSVVPGKPPHIALPDQGEAEIMTSAGQVLAAQKIDVPVPIASVTKIMTAYVVLSDHPLAVGAQGPPITVSASEAATLPARIAEDQSLVAVTAGEQISELTALEALLIPSADNMADILAVFDAGSESAFVAKMNATAKSLGMDNTSYADASGFDAASRSTASDLLILARRAMAVPVFAEIVGMPSVTLPLAGTVSNYNSLVGKDGYTGIKTGSTGAAGGCLVWSVTRTVDSTPLTLYGVVLGQHQGPLVQSALDSAAALTTAAFAAFTPRTVLAAGTPVYRVSWAGQMALSVTTQALKSIYPPGSKAHIVIVPATPGSFAVKSGPVATLKLTTPVALAGAGSTGVALTSKFRSPSMAWRVKQFLGLNRS